MSLQARASQWDHRLYNVNRDVAHCFGDVCREAAARLEDQDWPFLKDVCARYEITQDQLGEACRAFLEFVATATEHREERRPALALARVGWLDLPDAAQFAFLAILGTVMMGYFWTGVHEATLGGEGPCRTLGDLRDAGRLTAEALMLPRWRRRLVRWRQRAGAALGALRARAGGRPR